MHRWRHLLREAALSGTLASVASTLALLVAGRLGPQHPLAPVNAISHWLWGDRALHEDGPSLRHTAAGYLIHHVASLFWSTLHALAWDGGPQPPARAIAAATATSAVACFVDFQLTPRRLKPGFEERLSRPALAGVYACFAIGLAAGTLLASRRR
jgi:hypothetical protein